MEYRPVIGPNSAGGVGYGPMVVNFPDGHKVEIWAPYTEISGLMYGERAFNFYGTLTIKDNEHLCEVVFNPSRKTGLRSLFSMLGG